MIQHPGGREITLTLNKSEMDCVRGAIRSLVATGTVDVPNDYTLQRLRDAELKFDAARFPTDIDDSYASRNQ